MIYNMQPFGRSSRIHMAYNNGVLKWGQWDYIVPGLDLLNTSSMVIRLVHYPIKNYRGLSPHDRGKRWAYVHLIRGATNHPISHLRPTFGLQEFSHCLITSNNTIGLPSDCREISHLRIISIHTNYGLPAEKFL